MKTLAVKNPKRHLLGALCAVICTHVFADDIAMTQWGDEFALDRHPLTYNSKIGELANNLFYRNAQEIKSPIGLYFGKQNTPNSRINNQISSSESDRGNEVDSYFGFRQQFSIFSYNVGVKSYNNDSNYVSKNWMQLNLDEYYVGARVMQFGVGLAQNRTASHSRLSYYKKLNATAMQFDIGSTTILASGEKYMQLKFNAAQHFKDIRAAFSLNKSFAPDHDLPVEAHLEVSRAFNMNHL